MTPGVFLDELVGIVGVRPHRTGSATGPSYLCGPAANSAASIHGRCRVRPIGIVRSPRDQTDEEQKGWSHENSVVRMLALDRH